MLATYVKRGVQAGVVAGLVFGLFVALVANPFVAFADELGQEGHHAASEHHEGGHSHHDSAVSVTVTNAVSVVSGVLWGILLGGGLFGIGYYFLEPVIPGTGGTKSYLLAAAGFVTVSGAPWLVLPPRPPGVGQSLPTDTRILLYGGMMVVGALVCLSAALAYRRLQRTRGRLAAASVGVLPFGLLAIPAVLSPANPVEGSLPPELATGLTGMIVFGQVVLWTLLAGGHARLGRRSADEQSSAVGGSRPDATVAGD